MGILINDEIEIAIDSGAKTTSNSVVILTGFCKEKAFCKLAEAVNSNVKNKKIVVRFLLNDILSKASDLEVYEQAKKYGWELYIKLDLHAKVYIFDEYTCIIGSSNLTAKGMNLSQCSNLETAATFHMNEKDMQKIENIVSSSILIDDETYYKMKSQVNITGIENYQKGAYWETDTFKVQKYSLKLSEFPSVKIDVEAFKKLSHLEQSNLKTQFINSRPFMWLRDTLNTNDNNEMFFGELAEALHNKVADVPKPYRKDVKNKVDIILSWVSVLCYEEFLIDKPRYSTRVKLIN